MSYDLNFWKQKAGVKLDPQVVYEKLSDGKRVKGLETLPIDQILTRFQEVFAKGWEQLDPLNWERKRSKGSFQIFTTPQYFRVDCYGMSGEDMNKIVDIGLDFDCPLFDPQVGKRFDGS